jgi:mannosyltransferase
MPGFTLRQPTLNQLRPLFRAIFSHWKLITCVFLLLLLEVCVHLHSYAVSRPSTPLDAPFHTGCQDPVLNTTSRANAVMMMLARNSEAAGAAVSVRSVQEQFNDNFGYPWVFLNDVEWSEEFKATIGEAVGQKAQVSFDVIPKEMWGYPEWIDQERAKKSMQAMEAKEIQYAGKVSYHHMCRFQSGYVSNFILIRRCCWQYRSKFVF